VSITQLLSSFYGDVKYTALNPCYKILPLAGPAARRGQRALWLAGVVQEKTVYYITAPTGCSNYAVYYVACLKNFSVS